MLYHEIKNIFANLVNNKQDNKFALGTPLNVLNHEAGFGGAKSTLS